MDRNDPRNHLQGCRSAVWWSAPALLSELALPSLGFAATSQHVYGVRDFLMEFPGQS